MSHFTVMVIGDNPEKQLKPYDENLRTEFVDKSEECRKEYETKIISEFYCASSSSWGFRITEDLFNRIRGNKPGTVMSYAVTKLEPFGYLNNGKKYRGYFETEDRKRCEGDAWFEVEEIVKTTHPDPDVCFEGEVLIKVIEPPKEIPIKEKYPDYEDYLRDWHGYKQGETGYWHNPKAKWDWYELGGRWTGYFKVKPIEVCALSFELEGFTTSEVNNLIELYTKQPEKFEKVISKYNGKTNEIRKAIVQMVETVNTPKSKLPEYVTGTPGLMTEPAEKGYADQLLLKDIDLNAMFEESRAKAKKTYKRAHELIAGEPFVRWNKVKDEMFPNDIEKARDFYNTQPPVKRFYESKDFGIFDSPDKYDIPEIDYVKRAEDGTLSTFAVLKDGKWYEKGEMGWWGMVSNEQDQDEWNTQVTKLINGLPEDTLISLYDCHI